MQRTTIILTLLALAAGCYAPKDYYTTSETGPHGAVTVKKVYYTPEERAARDDAQRQARGMPIDDQMKVIEQNWPKLTDEQRTAVMKMVEQMAAGK